MANKKDELNKLQFKRGQIKSNLTRFQVFLDTLDQCALDQTIVTQLNCRLDKIYPLYDEFSQLQSEIEYIVENEELDIPIASVQKEYAERIEFENQYFNIVSKAAVIDADLVKKRHSEENLGNDCNSMSSENNKKFTFSIKLPEMKLPKFSGSFDQWLEFRDAFISMIDKNPSLDTIQKFYYLRAHLEGEAAQMIHSIQVTEQNYDIAISLLKQRYENNRLIIFNYVRALFDAPAVVRESHGELRNLFDTFNKNIRSLNALGQPTDQWSIILIYLITSKFDNRTRRDWEAYPCSDSLPTLEDITLFLKKKCELLEKVEVAKGDNSSFYSKPQNKSKPKYISAYVSQCNNDNRRKFACFYCKAPHSIFKCTSFGKLEVSKRSSEAKRLRLCLNCLNPSHNVNQCPKEPCRQCSKYMNSILHNHLNSNSLNLANSQHSRSTMEGGGTGNLPQAGPESVRSAEDASAALEKDETSLVVTSSCSTQSRVIPQDNKIKYVLLSTATVCIQTKCGDFVKATVLLDPGSQSNFISQAFYNQIGLDKVPVNFSITGVGNCETVSSHFQTQIKLKSCLGGFSKKLDCLILPKITQAMPICSFDSSFMNIPGHIKLADPEFNVKKEIDILCGVTFFFDILLMNQMKLNKDLTLQATKLGWILGGELTYSFMNNNKIVSCLSIYEEINQNLIRFWEIEECDTIPKSSDVCEMHFKENIRRDKRGRFVVKIPFKSNISQLGQSKEMALKSFENLERRLLKNTKLKKEYDEFMDEYERLGHMTVLNENINELSDGDCYYLCHHAVIKTSSLTTRVRVVFNGSACTDSGLSLNDTQYTGPTVQNDLLSIILNFRKSAYVLNADISKMYRQVKVDKSDRRYQRIIWRKDPSEDLKCFELNVVTYGLTSSPYLATRCLLQLALENVKKYPLASDVIKNCFYIDDLLMGSDSRNELLQLQQDISKILSNAGFELRKYISNEPELLTRFHVNSSLEASLLQLGENENNKTLGVYWNANRDSIQYVIQNVSDFSCVTKRSILSTISQIFDVLGLLGPIVIRAKVILQLLWKEQLSWDQEVLGSLREKWITFCEDLSYLNNLEIPRHVFVKNTVYTELHTFADASEKSYGTCSYIRCRINENEFSCYLIAAKSKVAPVRPVTLPRLELTSAVLGAKLAEKIKSSLRIDFDKTYYWSDSMITLCWIRGPPERWKKFVANRVGVIQNKTHINEWFHVRSEDNPADLISRGISAQMLKNNTLWFEGPHWLKLPNSEWPQIDAITEPSDIPEGHTLSNLGREKVNWDIFLKFSSLTKLQRVIALCRRFIHNLTCGKSGRIVGEVSVKEMQDSFNCLIKIAQIQSFYSELNDLKINQTVNKSSNISSLHPFLDEKGIIRVGGRIQRANVSYSKKHPIILNNKHRLTELIMINEHIRLFHCGPQQLLYSVRESFWPLAGRNLARHIVHKCLVCFKIKPKPFNYLMGNLPSERVTQCPPFFNTGCDYAGYFLLKDSKTRSNKVIKAYVCVFVCMVTKAMHLELVTSLRSDAFLATLRRFVARRGKPLNIFSDNGSNFVGANSELCKFLKINSEGIKHCLVNEGINWHFIPPRAPSFGGLWEAGVKSVKHHLKRVVGNLQLDYEDFSTVLTQIESILNSRPLSPMSSSPDDFAPLTPGHFLIGRSLTSLPDPNVTEVKENRLRKFRRLQQLVQHFWTRWHKEYVSELQSRLKWKQNGSKGIQVGDLVLVKDDNVPPLQWKLGRVSELFPGEDNVIRVVLVKFSDGNFARRAISKLCPLPIDHDHSVTVI